MQRISGDAKTLSGEQRAWCVLNKMVKCLTWRCACLHVGASEMLMANSVQELSGKTPGKESIAIESFARALRQLPTIIADNAGYDSSELVSQLRALHSEGQRTMGLGEGLAM